MKINDKEPNKFDKWMDSQLKIFDGYEYDKPFFIQHFINNGFNKLLDIYTIPFYKQYKLKNNKKEFIKGFHPNMLLNLSHLDTKLNDFFYISILEIEKKLKNVILIGILFLFNLDKSATIKELLESKLLNHAIEIEKLDLFNKFVKNQFKNSINQDKFNDYKEFLNSRSIDSFINDLTFSSTLNLFNYFTKISKAIIIENFFPMILNKTNQQSLKDFQNSLSQEENIDSSKHDKDSMYFDKMQELYIETFQLYLENIIHLRNMIYHGKSYFEFEFINFQKFQRYDRGIEEDLFSLFVIIIRLKAPNRYEELIAIADACLKIKNYYFMFNIWKETEADNFLSKKYGIMRINEIIENHKKLCELLIKYGFDTTFQAMQIVIYSDYLVNVKNSNFDDIYKKMEEWINTTESINNLIDNQSKH